MALVLKGGAVFLHIPKTGGNWVTAALENADLLDSAIGHKHTTMDRLLGSMYYRTTGIQPHLKLRDIRRRLDPKPFMFCFVRHPLRWYESWFKYMTQPSRNWRNWGDENDLFDWHPNAVLNGCGAAEFNDFVRNVLAKRPGYVSELYGWYAAPQVDFVGRQENLRKDLAEVLERAGLPFDRDVLLNFKEVGVSPEPTKAIEWDSALRERVLEVEKVALLRYGYDTD